MCERARSHRWKYCIITLFDCVRRRCLFVYYIAFRTHKTYSASADGSRKQNRVFISSPKTLTRCAGILCRGVRNVIKRQFSLSDTSWLICGGEKRNFCNHSEDDLFVQYIIFMKEVAHFLKDILKLALQDDQSNFYRK